MNKGRRTMENRIRELRQQMGITQEQLSKEANISTKQIQRIETGNASARLCTLKAIAKALNSTVSYLIYESDTNSIS